MEREERRGRKGEGGCEERRVLLLGQAQVGEFSSIAPLSSLTLSGSPGGWWKLVAAARYVSVKVWDFRGWGGVWWEGRGVGRRLLG